MDIDYIRIYQSFQKAFSSNNKNIILEPISCILRIILLIYKEEGTKVSFMNNSIQYNLPGYTQGFMRNITGDKREDLHNLYNPLLKSFEWYPPQKEIYRYFYQKSILGIDLLLKSYEKDTIIHYTLQHYKKMIKDSLESKEIEKIDTSESPLLNNMKDFWEEEEFEIIFKMLKLIDKIKDNNVRSVYISSINNIVTMKEQKVCEYINKYSTSYH